MDDLLVLWENFGPMHIDRCEALAAALDGQARVIGVQWTDESAVYPWTADPTARFRLVTLFPGMRPADVKGWAKFVRTLRFCLGSRTKTFFFSHYNDPAIIGLASVLFLLRKRVFAMALSKFDDCDRSIWREVGKAVALRPYEGFLTNRGRSAEYLQFLRNGKARWAAGHNSLSVAEVRRLAGRPPAPDGLPHAERHFTAITRLVPKKNLFMLLDAYALYRAAVAAPRRLHICGSGPLEAAIRARIAERCLDGQVVLTGFVQRPAIARELGQALALILPSTEEQFGNVIIEAQAMGVPCLTSDNCGARETLIRSAVNGFSFEPDNPAGLARYMQWLDEDEGLWRELAKGCAATVGLCDMDAFVEGVRRLLGTQNAAEAVSHGSLDIGCSQ